MLLAAVPVRGQALNEAFLQNNVLITFEPAPGKTLTGTGVFLFRPTSGDQGHVFFVTNKRMLPPAGSERNVQIPVAMGSVEKSTVRQILVKIAVEGTAGR